MICRNHTILITGGSSGIGLALAELLLARQNEVIICGRSEDRLTKAKSLLPRVHTICCDISKPGGREFLVGEIRRNFPDCNVLINIAAVVNKTNFKSDFDMLAKTEAEINTNLVAPVSLTKLFLTHFESRGVSAVINITTGLVFAPRAAYPIYCATKAAVHSFTQVLRAQLKGDRTRIIEVMMPVVDTPWHKGEVPRIAISPKKAVEEMIKKIENGTEEVRVGKVNLLYWVSRISPRLAFMAVNNIDNKKPGE